MIPLLKPELPKPSKWLKYLNKSYQCSTFSNNGPCVNELEDRFKIYLGLSLKPLLVCNATLGLELVLKALNLDYKDEILIPTFTFAATAHSVLNAGLQPILVDCSDDLFLDISKAKERISPKTKAMVVVQALGFSCDYEKYEKFAKENNLFLIFDSAASMGTEYLNGKKVGCAGDAEVFSLHATKTFGIGEGSLITSKHAHILKSLRTQINFGFDNLETVSIGTNAKMSEIQASVGLSVLDEIDDKMKKRIRISSWYKKGLKKSSVKFFEHNSAHQVFAICFETKKDRDHIKNILDQNKVGNRVYYRPIHTHSYFKFLDKGDYVSSEYYYERLLCIPMFDSLKKSDVDKIVCLIKENL